MSHCVLLNADYSFLNVIEWKRAMCMVAKGKVQVLQYSDRMIRCAEGVVFKLPAVLKLIKLIRIVYRNRVPFSKRNVFIRDGFRCAYCGGERVRLTIDHIIPKSRGGGQRSKSAWPPAVPATPGRAAAHRRRPKCISRSRRINRRFQSF